MRTGFFHDTTFIKDNKQYYTKGQVNSEFIQKYKEYFGEITAIVKVEDKNDINHIYIESKNLITNANIIEVKKNYSNAIKSVKEAFEECHFAIIRMPSIIGIFACREARKRKIPYMIEMVGCPRDALWYHGGIKFKLCMPIITILNKIELKKAKNVIYVTEKFLQKRYKTNGNSIVCSDVNLPKISEEVLEFRKNKINKYNKNNKVYKFGLIGSLDVDYKGHELAIRTLALLKDKINFELHFLGTGNKEKWINLAHKYSIQDEIIFDGALPHNEIFKWMDELDVYMTLSKTEGMPRALIEAMSRACPCVGTKVGGIPELLTGEVLVNPRDYKKLAEKIENMIYSTEKMKRYAEENYIKAKKFQEKELDQKRNKYYKEIIEGLRNDKSITSCE